MPSSSHIAAASRLLGVHLLSGFMPPAWAGPPPALADDPGTDPSGDALCVWLYHAERNNALRNAAEARLRPATDARVMAPMALDLHYLIWASAADPQRAQQVLECACLQLHAEPRVQPAAGSASRPLVFAPVSRSPAELMALWQALALPPRPALAYQATVVMEAAVEGSLPPRVSQDPSG